MLATSFLAFAYCVFLVHIWVIKVGPFKSSNVTKLLFSPTPNFYTNGSSLTLCEFGEKWQLVSMPGEIRTIKSVFWKLYYPEGYFTMHYVVLWKILMSSRINFENDFARFFTQWSLTSMTLWCNLCSIVLRWNFC